MDQFLQWHTTWKQNHYKDLAKTQTTSGYALLFSKFKHTQTLLRWVMNQFYTLTQHSLRNNVDIDSNHVMEVEVS